MSAPRPGTTTAAANVQNLLPSAAVPVSSTNPVSASAASLLPPGAAPVPTHAAPTRPAAVTFGHESKPLHQPVIIPTEDGGFVSIREPVKVIGDGDEAIELRPLTPEEKARRKFRKNLLLWGFGLAMMFVVMLILLTMGPLKR
jgi:hypothetical protein